VAAAIELRKALEQGASPDAVNPPLARAVLMQGDARQVVMQFAALQLADAEAAADVKTVVGTAFAALGEPDKAQESVESALKDWPQHAGATLLQARLQAAQGDVPGAIARVNGLLDRDPKQLQALLFKGDLQRYGLRDTAAALATYDQALELQPKAVPAHVAGIQMLMEQGNTAAARARFDKLKTTAAQHPDTLLFEAQFAFIDRNFERTKELTDQLLRGFPDDVRVLQLAGVNDMRLGNLPQAEAHLARVVKAVPGEPVPRQMLARIYTRTGQPGRALEVLQPLINSPQADAASLTLAGEAFLQQGEPARAEAAFARATRADPKQATTARAALALGQLARGNTSAGFAELEAAAAADTGIRSNLALVAARLRSGDVPGALKAIDALEKKQPDSPVAPTLRASALMQKGDTAGATAAFEQALKIDPLFYSATAGLAAIELAAGRPEAAQKRFEAVLQRDPRNTRALVGLAELKARTGGTKDEVTAALQAAVKANPGESGPRVLLVNHLLGHNDATAALQAAQDANSALPASPDVVDALGMAQLAARQPQLAVTTFTRLASMRSDRPEPQLRLADAHAANNDLAAARNSLTKALEIRPNLLAAQRGLALIAVREGKPEDALRIAQQVQKANPQQPAGFLLEAEIEGQRQRPEAVVPPLRRALQVAPSTELAIRLHAALDAAGQAAEAERHAGAWLRERPRDAGFRYYLGDRAIARQDYAGAESQYRQVLQVQPDNALAMNNVAWLMTQQGKPGALPLAERANQLLPNQPAILDTLAWVLANDKQVPRALEVQRQAMARAPQDHNLRLTLAKIHLQGGDKAQARAELETLARLGTQYGNQAEVTRLLGTL
jgi:putative PEP-CTERM system TPR-repeat lipoprotein